MPRLLFLRRRWRSPGSSVSSHQLLSRGFLHIFADLYCCCRIFNKSNHPLFKVTVYFLTVYHKGAFQWMVAFYLLWRRRRERLLRED